MEDSPKKPEVSTVLIDGTQGTDPFVAIPTILPRASHPNLKRSMPDAMAQALGYDHMGNSPGLLSQRDKHAIDVGWWRRADQNTRCQVCFMQYYMHPPVQGALWLIRTCEGLVKL